jgi:hypothetical protein
VEYLETMMDGSIIGPEPNIYFLKQGSLKGSENMIIASLGATIKKGPLETWPYLEITSNELAGLGY